MGPGGRAKPGAQLLMGRRAANQRAWPATGVRGRGNSVTWATLRRATLRRLIRVLPCLCRPGSAWEAGKLPRPTLNPCRCLHAPDWTALHRCVSERAGAGAGCRGLSCLLPACFLPASCLPRPVVRSRLSHPRALIVLIARSRRRRLQCLLDPAIRPQRRRPVKSKVPAAAGPLRGSLVRFARFATDRLEQFRGDQLADWLERSEQSTAVHR